MGSRNLWILDNALPAGNPRQVINATRELRPGNNRSWEFSAWERALEAAKAEGLDFDLVHFVTSAFNTLYTSYLDHFFPGMLDYVVERNVCLGHLDGYNRPVRIGDAVSQAWIRTCFFFLPGKPAQSISPWAFYRDPSLVFETAQTRQFKAGAPIEPNYQFAIASWLAGDEIGGHRWHSPVGPESSDTDRFQRKALAILNEHRLAITLREAGLRLVDFCWLHSFRATPGPIISDPPSEVEQMGIRRKLLGFDDNPPSPDRLESC